MKRLRNANTYDFFCALSCGSRKGSIIAFYALWPFAWSAYGEEKREKRSQNPMHHVIGIFRGDERYVQLFHWR